MTTALTWQDLGFSIRARLSDFDFNAQKVSEIELLDLANLSQEDMVRELPDSALIRLTKQKMIASIVGQERYDFPTDMHKMLNLTQNDDGGLDAPTVALESPAVAGLVDVGAHRYRISAVIGSTEGLAGPPSDAVTVVDIAVNGKVRLTAIPLGPYGTTSRKIYRTLANGSTYKLAATIADNTTVTYLDNIADAALTTTASTVSAGIPKPSELSAATMTYKTLNLPNAYVASSLERPTHYVDHNSFFVYPIPTVTRAGYFRLSQISVPTRMTALASSCSFDQQYSEILVLKTCIKAMQKLGSDPAQAIGAYTSTLQLLGLTIGNVHRIGGKGSPAAA